MTGRVEIAGGGLAGLTCAVAFLRRGWSVVVSERSPAIRADGFSINIQENGLRVFEALGLLDRFAARGMPVPDRQVRDGANRVAARLQTPYRVMRIPRQHIVAVLAQTVSDLGGVVRTGQSAARADPEGALVFEGGERRPADLVVAADGVNSRLRDDLGLLRRRLRLNEGATRILLPRQVPAFEGDDGRTGFEVWSGRRRFMYRPAGPDEAYLTFGCPADDERGRAVPIDVESWASSFPQQGDLIRRLAGVEDWSQVWWARFELVQLRCWSRGKVAVIGDAAHAMPPNLGQGGGIAMMNALSLAAEVSGQADIPGALAAWERRERPLTGHTQFWSWLYSMPARFPRPLRDTALSLAGRSRFVARQMQRAARHAPTGWVEA